MLRSRCPDIPHVHFNIQFWKPMAPFIFASVVTWVGVVKLQAAAVSSAYYGGLLGRGRRMGIGES